MGRVVTLEQPPEEDTENKEDDTVEDETVGILLRMEDNDSD